MQPLELLDRGVAVIPIRYGDKRPLVPWGKYQSSLPTQYEVQQWGKGKVNWAAVCGWQGLTVLDFDDRDAYGLWYTWAAQQKGVARDMAEKSYRVLTSRGVHVYAFVQDKPKSLKAGLIDVKGEGGYVLIPPSVHPSGCSYTPLQEDSPILEAPSLSFLLPLPAELRHQAATEGKRERLETDAWHLADTDRALHQQGTDKVAAIKRRLKILDLLPGASRTDHEGRWWLVRCPFHDDRAPSFWIDAERGLCGCYAGCTGEKPLDVINLYGKLHGLSNREAIQNLWAQLGGR